MHAGVRSRHGGLSRQGHNCGSCRSSCGWGISLAPFLSAEPLHLHLSIRGHPVCATGLWPLLRSLALSALLLVGRTHRVGSSPSQQAGRLHGIPSSAVLGHECYFGLSLLNVILEYLNKQRLQVLHVWGVHVHTVVPKCALVCDRLCARSEGIICSRNSSSSQPGGSA